jgi:tetratricopeptide (TPR) repeat protein
MTPAPLPPEENYTPFATSPEARALNDRACTLSDGGDDVGALVVHEQALALVQDAQDAAATPAQARQAALDVALIKRVLAVTHGDLGRWSRAQSLHEEVLAIRKRVLGRKHTRVAQAMTDIAYAMAQQDHHLEAEAMLQRALVMREDLLGPNHPDLTRTLKCLAESFVAKGNFARAKPLLLRAVAIAEQHAKPDRLPADLCSALFSLAGLLITLPDQCT